MTIQQLLDELYRKGHEGSLRSNPNNKYMNAFNFIDQQLATNPPDVETMIVAILKSEAIYPSNAPNAPFSLKGGDTKKNRKHGNKHKRSTKKQQRGGFLWGKNRTSQKTTASLSNSNASLTKSTSSSYNKSKKNNAKGDKKNRGRGVSKHKK
jgi:hypothetical protein